MTLLLTFVLPCETAAATSWGEAAGAGIGGDYKLADTFCNSSAVFDSAVYIGTTNEAEGCGVLCKEGPGWTQVNAPGFGNPGNFSAESMAVFGDNLYVGTFNMSGCEVWRYDGSSWTRVVGPGGSLGRGFGSAHNTRATSMMAFGTDLYIGTENSAQGLEIWRSDGDSWTQVDGDLFGAGNTEASSMEVFDVYLYVGTANTAGCQVWRSPNGTAWSQRAAGGFGSGNNFVAASMAVFGTRLYVGTHAAFSAMQIHSTPDGTLWTREDAGLFGANNEGGLCMETYGGRLYVGTCNNTQGAQVWSAPDGSTWSRAETGELSSENGAMTMAAFAGKLYVGTMQFADVWCYDGSWTHSGVRGFTSNCNIKTASMAVYEGRLYAGTSNPLGCEVWRSDGSSWERLAGEGFGDIHNTSATCMEVYKGDLYIGTSNNDDGCQAWRFDGSTFSKLGDDGFDDPNNDDVRCMEVYGGKLYVGTYNNVTGGELFAYDGVEGEQVNDDGFGDAANFGVDSLAVYDGRLYVGTFSLNGCEVWSTAAEGGPPYTDWSQLAAGGFGDADNRRAKSMAVLGDVLHVGTANTPDGCEVWSYNGMEWKRAGVGGFGDVHNREASSMAVHDGRLYVGTWQEPPAGGTGCEIWSTAGKGGTPYGDWRQENEDGFGDVESREAGAMVEYFSSLFVGGVNYYRGCSVWNTGSVWYLAEGATLGGFETWVLVQNPGAAPVHVDFTLNTGEGEVKPLELRGVEIPAGSRRSFDLGKYVQTYDVSTRVVARDGLVICERAMYWTPPGAWARILGHDSIGVTYSNPTWYMAEGATYGGFETYVLVQNPGGRDVHVDFTLNTDRGEVKPPELQGVLIEAGSRATFNLASWVKTYEVSTRVKCSDGEVICERAMYWCPYDQGARWVGHDSIGVTSPAPFWYLAEGATYGGFETWVLVQNPGEDPVHVDFILNTDQGEVKPPQLQGVEIGAGKRASFDLGLYVQTYDVSTYVHCLDGLVVCERAMYLTPPGGPPWSLGHDSVGVNFPTSVCYLPEGATYGGFSTWVLVQNPGEDPVHVDFTLNTDQGEVKPPQLQGVEIGAGERASFDLGLYVQTYDVSTKVVCSDGVVVCERAMYWKPSPGAVWTLGHDSIGYTP